MASRTSGLRDRVYHAMVASAGIFTLALAFWGVNAYQQSEANTPGGARTTITFEEYAAPRELGTTNEYIDKGVRFSDDSGNTNRTTALTKEGAVGCTAEQIATSGTNRLHPLPNPSDPLVITFTDNRVSNDVSFQLLGVQSAKNVVEFFDHTGKLLNTTEYVNPGGGCDKKQLVSLSQANIAKIRITQPGNNFAVTQDGLAIDDFSFATLTNPVNTSTGTFSISPSTGTAPLTVTGTYTPAPNETSPTNLVWDFGEGADSEAAPLGTVTVLSDGTVATSPVVLEQGKKYTIQVSGTVKYALPDPAEADAEYMSLADASFSQREDVWHTADSSEPHCGTTPTLDIGLAIDDTTNYANKTPRWGEFQSNHVYTTTYTGKGQKPTFRFLDCANGYVNNSGSFTVTILNPQSGIKSGTPVTHEYTKPGTYAVSLSANGKSVGTKTVTVNTSTPNGTVSTALTTDKSTYKPGETVTFTLENTGPTKIELPNGAPYKITGNGQAVYNPVSTQSVTALEAGKSYSWTWNQKDDAGTQIKDGAYIVAVTYSANGKSETKSASFTISSDAKPVDPKGTFSVTPSSGTAPLTVTAKCEGDTITGLIFDFGDGTVTENVTCPTSLTHTYSKEGSYTITVRQGDKVLTTQSVTVSAASAIKTDDGKGKPSALASTGANLLLVILLAAVLSGLVSYFIIRRPFHGDQE